MTPKIAALFRKLIVELTAHYRYNALVRYRVIGTNVDGRLRLQIENKRSGFPDALPLSIWPGVPGGHGQPTPGAVVLVQFIEGDPGLPVVTHFARKEDGAFVPVNASLDATALVRIGEHATLTQLGSGSIGYNGTNDAERVVRWGDFYMDPSAGATMLVPAPLSSISKVKA